MPPCWRFPSHPPPPNTNNVIFAQAQTAPGTPSSVTVTRADGTLTASWDAVDGATSYHVTWSDNGKASWSLAALDHPASGGGTESITFGADNAKTYVVGVRAKNEHGGGGWRNSPAAGPYTPPAPTPPGTPSSVTVTRADGTLTASWDAPTGAATYHVTYSDNGGASWSLAALDHPAGGGSAESITIGVTNASTYIVGVRAKNGAGGGGWRNSPASGPFTPPTPEPTPEPTPAPTPEPTPEPPTPPAAPTGLTATAGDGSVTLSWDDPADPSITGYEYRLNHNATPTGNFSGWGTWTAVANSGAATASHTFTGLAAGREYRYRLRAVNAEGAGAAAPNAAPWFASATPTAPAFGQVLQVSDVTPTTATLTLEDYPPPWYYRRTSGSGGSAGIASGASASNASNPQCNGPVNSEQTVAEGLPPGQNSTFQAYSDPLCSQGMAGAASVNTPLQPEPQQGQPPSAPPKVWFQRVCDDYFKVKWERSPGINVYDLNVSYNGGKSWHRLMTDKNYNAWLYWQWSTNSNFKFGVRAGNAHGESAWTNSPDSAPPPCAPDAVNTATHVAHTEDSGGNAVVQVSPISVSWPSARRASAFDLNVSSNGGVSWTRSASSTTVRVHSLPVSGIAGHVVAVRSRGHGLLSPWARAYPAWLTASAVAGTTATLDLEGHAGGWYVKQTAPSAGTCAAGEADFSHAVTGLAGGTQHTFRAYSDDACADEFAAVTFTTGPALTVTGVTAFSATLNVAGHSGQWWFQADTGPDSTCQGPVGANTATKALTGLLGSTSYTYSAYSDNGCSTLIAAAAQFTTTTPSHVTNLHAVANPDPGSTISSSIQQGAAFTTGPSSGGYTLGSVAISMKKSGNVTPGDLAITLHRMEGTGSYSHTSSAPSTTTLATLTGTAPTSTSYTDTFFTCSGSGCDLDAGATYFVVATYTGASGKYQWRYSDVDDQSGSPSGNGWKIQRSHQKSSGNAWFSWADWHIVRAEFTYNPALTASAVTSTTATLTIANYTGAWYYKADVAPDTSCSARQTGTTAGLTGLTTGTAYNYTAYSDSGCTTANLLATAAEFTTP